MKNTLTILFIFQAILAYGQFQKKLVIKPDRLKSVESIVIDPEFEFSSVAVGVSAIDGLRNACIISEQDTFFLHADEHDTSDSIVFSNLIVFENNQQQIKFHSNNFTDKVTFYFLNAHSETLKSANKADVVNEDCLCEPKSISQEEWREGLPAPDYERIVHKVHNLIIHHSAGSNTDTSYTNVIRNIYLYHTQSKGWSDIGYNYIVAQNGQLYKGRDPGEFEQDNIKGAHFCGSNTGTMGVCVLGNYEEVQAPDTALMTLSKLLAWKADKEGIDPYSYYAHPLNVALGCIAGHKDGCATLCPGKNLYNVLPDICYRVDSILTKYGSNVGTGIVEVDNQTIEKPFVVNYKNKTISLIDNTSSIKEVTVYDYTGKIVLQNSGSQIINYQGVSPGIYLLHFKTKKQAFTHKLLLY